MHLRLDGAGNYSCRSLPTDATTPELSAVARRLGRVVHATRTAQGRSLGDLSRASGLSKTILARIERGEGNPSVETLWRVSQALKLPLGALLTGDEEPRVHTFRARTGEPLRSEAGMAAWLIDAESREHRAEVYELDLPSGVDQRSEPHLPGTEELVVCIAGVVVAGPLGEEVELRAGDAVRFFADVAHRYEARASARALCWMRYGVAGR